jgi:hypothetical protein
MIINPYLVQPSIPAFTGLLDTYSGASAAYSAARRLATSYTGSLIRVRRSSDNAEQDIGYNGSNVLDEAALTTFVGAGNGFVTTWYDQSGNGNNETQTTAINQPRIVNSGTVEKMNSLPSIYFNTTYFIRANFMSSATSATFFAFTAVDTDPPSWTNGGILSTLKQSSSANHVPYSDGVIYEAFGTNSRKTVGNPTNSLATPYLYAVKSVTNDYKVFINNSQFYSTNTNTVSFAHDIMIGSSDDVFNIYPYKGKISELIIYPSYPDKDGISGNINTNYSIY